MVSTDRLALSDAGDEDVTERTWFEWSDPVGDSDIEASQQHTTRTCLWHWYLLWELWDLIESYRAHSSEVQVLQLPWSQHSWHYSIWHLAHGTPMTEDTSWISVLYANFVVVVLLDGGNSVRMVYPFRSTQFGFRERLSHPCHGPMSNTSDNSYDRSMHWYLPMLSILLGC